MYAAGQSLGLTQEIEMKSDAGSTNEIQDGFTKRGAVVLTKKTKGVSAHFPAY